MPSVDVEGLNIHYDQRGAGPDVALFHGIGGNTRLWRYQLERLSDSFRVTAWAAPGYGGSDDPDSAAWTMADYARTAAGPLGRGRAAGRGRGESMGGAAARKW